MSIILSLLVEGSRDILGTSSLLFDRFLRVDSAGRSTEEGGAEAPLRVFVREPRLAERRDIEDTRSRTKEFVSGS